MQFKEEKNEKECNKRGCGVMKPYFQCRGISETWVSNEVRIWDCSRRRTGRAGFNEDEEREERCSRGLAGPRDDGGGMMVDEEELADKAEPRLPRSLFSNPSKGWASGVSREESEAV